MTGEEKLRAAGVVVDGDIIGDAERLAIGANGPPPEPTPFEQSRVEIDKLYRQAKDLLDGAEIDNELAAMEVGTLRNEIRAAAKLAEERRVAEAKPFDEAKKKVQDAYNPLIQKGKGLTELALAACNSALAPYLKKKDDDLRAEAAKAAVEANRIAREARDAAQAAAQSGDLTARETAEDLLKQAKGAVSDMKHAEKARSQITGVGGRAIGMRSVWTPVLIDPAAAIEFFRRAAPAELKIWMVEEAVRQIRAGPKPPAPMPGFRIDETKVPV